MTAGVQMNAYRGSSPEGVQIEKPERIAKVDDRGTNTINGPVKGIEICSTDLGIDNSRGQHNDHPSALRRRLIPDLFQSPARHRNKDRRKLDPDRGPTVRRLDSRLR